MLNLNIAVCDDSETDINTLHSILENYEIKNNTNLHIDIFKNSKDLFSAYKENIYHIIFLDVEMPSDNGIDIAQIIRTTVDRHAIIVFVSNYPEYMQDSFKVHPFHYITKPATYDKIYELMDDIIQEIQESNIFYTLISSDDKNITVNIKDIIYIDVKDGQKGILCFHFEDKELLTKGTITDWYEKLKEYNFYQCFRGTLINLLHIHYIENRKIILNNGAAIPISKTGEKELRDMYFNRIVTLRNL